MPSCRALLLLGFLLATVARASGEDAPDTEEAAELAKTYTAELAASSAALPKVALRVCRDMTEALAATEAVSRLGRPGLESLTAIAAGKSGFCRRREGLPEAVALTFCRMSGTSAELKRSLRKVIGAAPRAPEWGRSVLQAVGSHCADRDDVAPILLETALPLPKDSAGVDHSLNLLERLGPRALPALPELLALISLRAGGGPMPSGRLDPADQAFRILLLLPPQGGEAAAPILIPLLDHPTLALPAALALIHLGTIEGELGAALLGLFDRRLRACPTAAPLKYVDIEALGVDLRANGTPPWLEQLRTTTLERAKTERCPGNLDAVRLLGELGGKAAIGFLASSLRDHTQPVARRRAAAKALEASRMSGHVLSLEELADVRRWKTHEELLERMRREVLSDRSRTDGSEGYVFNYLGEYEARNARLTIGSINLCRIEAGHPPLPAKVVAKGPAVTSEELTELRKVSDCMSSFLCGRAEESRLAFSRCCALAQPSFAWCRAP